MAEAVGFEPTVGFPLRSVSNRVLSASQPRFRRFPFSHGGARGQEGKDRLLRLSRSLHRDGLSSVRAITDAAGVKVESAVYKPFGEQSEWVLPGNAAPETKGWIGERYDADAGLQYLNARYYDPELILFLQPDWFKVTKAGVGTNRFSYSFNDPVNKMDPGGNYFNEELASTLEKGAVVVVETGVKALARTIGLAVAFALEPTMLAVSTLPEKPKLGKVLTGDMIDRGWYVDGKGQIISPDGQVIVDKDGNFRSPDVYGSQEEFDRDRYKGKSQPERDAFTTDELSKIAELRGWTYDPEKTKRSGKKTYKTDFGYAVIDKAHGQYEYHDQEGKHHGQYNIEGKNTKDPKPGYDMRIK